MVLDKIQYVSIENKNIGGMDARSKEWYCKELVFKDADDFYRKATAINNVLNKLNGTDKTKVVLKEKKK